MMVIIDMVHVVGPVLVAMLAGHIIFFSFLENGSEFSNGENVGHVQSDLFGFCCCWHFSFHF
jgi:hypothetical protein